MRAPPDPPRPARRRPDELHLADTRDGWRVALHRYRASAEEHATPVILCHGMGSNRFNLDGPGELSLAHSLRARGYDVWLLELRAAGRSRRRLRLPPVSLRFGFEDYVQHDAPAALRRVCRETGRDQVLWVGHSLGGMVAYGLLMTPAAERVAGAVTLASPGMTDVREVWVQRVVPWRDLLRFAPARIPTRLAARMASPAAGPLVALLRRAVTDLGWHRDNLDVEVVRFMMRHGVEDLPRSLLAEFARWVEDRRMSDRYGLYSFHDHLERIRAPILLIAGAKDRLTPPADIERVALRIASEDKQVVVAGREGGFDHDYSHVDLVLGRHAPEEIYPLVAGWLDDHRRKQPVAAGRGMVPTS